MASRVDPVFLSGIPSAGDGNDRSGPSGSGAVSDCAGAGPHALTRRATGANTSTQEKTWLEEEEEATSSQIQVEEAAATTPRGWRA